MNPSRLFILRPVATVCDDGRGSFWRGASAYRQAVPPFPSRLSDHPGADVLSRRRADVGFFHHGRLERQFGQMPG